MLQYLNHFIVCAFLLISTPVQASFFDYPRDARFQVLEYTQSNDMIRTADTQPLLRIFGNGRVLVHFPVYMKRAGDYEMVLTDVELQQLLSLLEQEGIFKVSSKQISKLKEKVIASRRVRPGYKLARISDHSYSRFKVNLGSYMSGLSFLPKYDFKQEVVLKNLRFDAQMHPSISELKNAANAERELHKFLNHKDLVKLK